jgi:CBS domain-containing protein
MLRIPIMITVSQIMNKEVRTLRPEATVAEAIELLTECHIGGAPVVNDAGGLVGMISELALIDVVFQFDMRFAPIDEFVTKDVYSVAPTDPVSRAAQLFALYSFRRLPVVENGKLVGIVTRRDLMSYILKASEVLNDPLVDLLPGLVPIVAGNSDHCDTAWD